MGRGSVIVGAGVACLVLFGPGQRIDASGPGGDPDPVTGIEQVVLYGIDDDTDELIRYGFGDQEYLVIGEARDHDGNLVDEIESLGFIPHGPHKGLYGVTNYDGDAASRLVKFSVLDATVTVYPVDVGYGNIEGMVAVREPDGAWTLYATQSGAASENGQVTLCHAPPGNPGNAHTITVGAPAVAAHLAHGDTLGPCGGDEEPASTRNLISIDPATGVGELLLTLGAKFEGLARGPDGTLYGARSDELWMIDPFNCPGLTLVGTHGAQDVEALEYAFGDTDPQVDVPGVPADWTAEGLLVGFSDPADSLLVFNPATGETVEYGCAVDTADCEGIVFLTEQSDPYLRILAGPCD